MMYCYYVGLDLGSRADYTALSVIEEPVFVSEDAVYPGVGWGWRYGVGGAGWHSPADISAHAVEAALEANRIEGRPPGVELSVRHLERLPLGTPYPQVVSRVGTLMGMEPLRSRPTALIADATGVGTSVTDSLVEAGLHPIGVTIHGGDKVTSLAGGFRVPKRDLVSAVQVLLQSGRLKIADGLPEASTLREELLNFRISIDPRTAHDSYSHWREGDHDDLVLSVAMAAWFRGYWNQHLDRANALWEHRGEAVM